MAEMFTNKQSVDRHVSNVLGRIRDEREVKFLLISVYHVHRFHSFLGHVVAKSQCGLKMSLNVLNMVS